MSCRRPWPAVLACGWIVSFLAGAQALGAGTLTGKIVYADKVPNLPPLDLSADPHCAAKHDGPVESQVLVLGSGNTLANVFVQVQGPALKSSYPTPSEPVVVDQVGCIYEPHVVGVMVGQAVTFRNSDGILHNVRAQPSENKPFNIAMPGMLKERQQTFAKPEPAFPVQCDIHPWMRAYIAVMSHPYFAVTGKDGQYRIEGLPAGSYQVQAWHEKLGTRTEEVTIGSGTSTADFTFKVPAGK